MLKILQTINFSNQIQTKCGEIFFHNFNNYTIYCTYCEIKYFQFEDFILHIQNQHFENKSISEAQDTKSKDLLKTVKDSNVSDDDASDNLDDSEVEEITVLKSNFTKTKKKFINNRKDFRCDKASSEVINDGIEHTSNLTSKKSNKVINYTCFECSSLFSQKKALDQHVIDVHNGYKCIKCDKRFRRSYHLSGHLKTHQSEKKFTCPIENCTRGFTEEEYLKRHLEVHTMQRTFLCDYENCGKAFHTQRRLNTHKYTHRMPKKLVCDMCGHSCRSNTELITHQRVHTGEKPFSCGICNKPFISKTALTEHMISHSDERPHVCMVCRAAFANRRVLVRHSFIHSDERTFKCKMCDKAFKHPNSLQGHLRHVHRKAKKQELNTD